MKASQQFLSAAFLASILCMGGTLPAYGQTLASTLEVYVFPTQGQDAGQQSQDEAACYEWAVGTTGSDPVLT